MILHHFKSTALLCAASLLAAVVSGPALAASINYGNVAGTNIVYQQVTESSLSALPLYGAPTVTGDSLQFTPQSFEAQSSTGAIDFVDGTLNTQIVANPNRGITTITLAEQGDYSLFGTGAYATISAPVFLRIDAVNGVPLITPITTNANIVFTSGAGGPGAYATPADQGLGKIWTGNLSVDINAVLAANNLAGAYATSIHWTMDNALTAYAPNGGISFIKKKDIGGVALTVVTSNIPEPSTFALLALGGSALFVLRRRNRA
ncbi:MAG: PEP-CTERM sorting domain-containing protein [Singulisphaera sp.]